jgi:hypothetical protein
MKISDPITGLVALHDQNNRIFSQLARSNQQQAALLTPGLKKQALELASTLMYRSTNILALAGRHGALDPRSNPNGWAAPGSPTFIFLDKQWQQEEAAHQQAETDAVQLISDYNNTYASQIVTLREECIQQGQNDWMDKEHYLNPSTNDRKRVLRGWFVVDIHYIQQIGAELSQHAVRLN